MRIIRTPFFRAPPRLQARKQRSEKESELALLLLSNRRETGSQKHSHAPTKVLPSSRLFRNVEDIISKIFCHLKRAV